MAITIKDIARLAGTSRGTVDRVFNNRGRVSQDMTDRILAVAAEHNYIPNESAKLLATAQKRRIIGVVINSMGNRFYDDVLVGIENARVYLVKYKVSIEVIQLRGYSDTEQVEAIDRLMSIGANAIAITPIESQLVKDKLQQLSNSNIPCVFINSNMDSVNRLATVGADNNENGALAGNIAVMALAVGSRVAIITGSYSNAGHISRVESFTNTIHQANKDISIVDVVECRDDDNMAYNAVIDILNRNKQLDLIYMCAGGVTGGIRAISDSGRQVKAITVDDNEVIRSHIQAGTVLATITQDPVQQGYRPLKVLADYIVFGRAPLERDIYTENRIRLAKSKW